MRSIYMAIGTKVKWLNIIAIYILQIVIFQIMLRLIFPTIEQNLGTYHMLDMVKQGYDSHYVVQLLSLMSDASQNMYLHVQMPLDFFYPVVMALVYFLVFTKVWRKYWYVFFVLPLLLILLDWAENISIILMFTNDNLIDSAVSWSSFFTQAKSIIGEYILYYLALFSVGVAIIKFLKQRLAQRAK